MHCVRLHRRKKEACLCRQLGGLNPPSYLLLPKSYQNLFGVCVFVGCCLACLLPTKSCLLCEGTQEEEACAVS